MYFKILLKVTKNQGFTLFIEDTVFEKTIGGVKLSPPSAVLGLIYWTAMLKNICFCRTPSSNCRTAMFENICFCRTPSLIFWTATLKNIYFCRTPSLICWTVMLENICFCRTPSLICWTAMLENVFFFAEHLR